jgi:hypothetical protein
MTTVDVRIERVGSGDRLYLHNGMWGPATRVLHAFGRACQDGRIPSKWNIAEINEVTTGAVVRQTLDSIEDQAHEREICPEPLRTVEIASLGQPARCQYQPEVGNPRAQDVACWP